MAIAAAVESGSEHPLARAIVAAAGHAQIPAAADFRSLTGRGVQATVEGQRSHPAVKASYLKMVQNLAWAAG